MAVRLHLTRPMRLFLAAALLAASVVATAGERDEGAAELNVNSRYTVESVNVAPQREYKLSGAVLAEMERLVGERLNVEALNRLSRRITEELRARSVTFRVYRGAEPARVRVTFEVEKRPTDFDLSLSRLTYNSREGWSGTGQITVTHGANALTVAGLSNGDDLVERYSGVRARYERLKAGSSRVRLAFEFDTFHEQYDGVTLASVNAAGSNFSLGAGAYRSRMNFEPSATFVLTPALTLSTGLSFESMQPDYARSKLESANALVSTLRYHRQTKDAEAGTNDIDAAYRLRIAARALGSDAVYTKHAVTARYLYRRGRQSADVAVLLGVIYGQAPLFERFVLGNNNTLRGWNKYDLDPIGGNRVAHASVTYGYQIMRVFYDTGSIWDNGRSPQLRHSAGCGITTGLGVFGKDALLLAVAFPLHQGRTDPVFIAGMNF